MRNFILILLSLVLTQSCSIEAENQKKEIVELDEMVEKTKLQYLKEVEWPKAYAEQDTLLLNRILGEDFQMIDQNGNVTDKNFELEWIKKNKTSHDSFYYEIKRLEVFSNGTAIISGTGHILNEGQKSIYQSSNILINRGNQWKAISSHVSGYKELD